MWRLLPEEVLTMILARLPVKSVGQLKCVSKLWRSLISEPHFTKSHLDRAISDPNTNHSRLFVMYPFHSLDYESPSTNKDVNDDDNNDNDDDNGAIVDLGFPSRQTEEGIEIVGSYNGMICLLYLLDCFVLWNPTIKDSIELPKPPFSISYFDFYFKGFGYNPSMDDYKVVIASREEGNPNVQSTVEVFSLKQSSWKEIGGLQNGLVIEAEQLSTCLNGNLHWLASCDTTNPIEKHLIVSLDLGTEEFSEISIPDCYDRSFFFHALGMINGCLSLLTDERNWREVGLWVMKEYGVRGSWTKLVILPTENLLFCDYLVPVCFTKAGDILIDVDGRRVVRYNLEQKTMKKLKTRSVHFIDWVLYVESLISPGSHYRISSG
ncbi:F-box/kelch-repeat protein At3g06240-like [Rhododendron vialii]|uniref:F-box/kelch-repeat protein At3g06240-like n=1 Tax=Rhododendron vialii TaxID=182163 RepID=UPI00265FF221|nr:F-box/kelch-repeat protein At3g06240-like [Rhododendron vialii]